MKYQTRSYLGNRNVRLLLIGQLNVYKQAIAVFTPPPPPRPLAEGKKIKSSCARFGHMAKAEIIPDNSYFITRVVILWNKLDEETTYTNSMELFKMGLSKF